MANRAFKWLEMHANSSSDVVVCTGTCVLHTVVINTKGASSNLLLLYDGPSSGGKLIATIDSTVTFGTLRYDVVCAVNLTAVLNTGTAASVTITFN